MDTDVIFAKKPSLVLEEIKPPSIKRHIESKHFSVWELFEGVLFKVNNNSFFYSNCVFQQNMKQKEKRPEVQQVDLLFPSPSGTKLSQGQGKKEEEGMLHNTHSWYTVFGKQYPFFENESHCKSLSWVQRWNIFLRFLDFLLPTSVLLQDLFAISFEKYWQQPAGSLATTYGWSTRNYNNIYLCML